MPLSYRGAVGFGDYALDANFIIGPAVDEAAAAHETAQAAIVWLLPRAREHVSRWLGPQPTSTHLVSTDVPLKGGDTLWSYTVSPIVQASDPADSLNIVQPSLDSFTPSEAVDVEVKRQNTAAHLHACYSWRGWKTPKIVVSTAAGPG